MLWLITTFPAWVFHLILFTGVAVLMFASLTSKIPGLAQYSLEFKIVSLVMIILGLMFEGALSLQNDYKIKEAELQHEIDVAEQKSATIVTKVVDQIVYRDKIITTQGTNTITYIDRVAPAIDKECTLSKEAVDGINQNAIDLSGANK
jgi:hypothetical protein